MAITGIFFGSDTGNTENIAKMIQKQLGKDVADVHDIAKSSKEDLEAYDILLLGIPTWYYGEAQCDWDDFFPTLEEIDFNGKLVALCLWHQLLRLTLDPQGAHDDSQEAHTDSCLRILIVEITGE